MTGKPLAFSVTVKVPSESRTSYATEMTEFSMVSGAATDSGTRARTATECRQNRMGFRELANGLKGMRGCDPRKRNETQMDVD
jgi:hypothetical protein